MDTSSEREKQTVAATKAVLMPEVLNLDDIAYWLHCSRSYARKLLIRGDLPGRRIARRWLVTRRALLEFVESQPMRVVQ